MVLSMVKSNEFVAFLSEKKAFLICPDYCCSIDLFSVTWLIELLNLSENNC